MSVYNACVRYPWRPQEGTASSGAGVADVCELPCPMQGLGTELGSCLRAAEQGLVAETNIYIYIPNATCQHLPQKEEAALSPGRREPARQLAALLSCGEFYLGDRQ